MLLLFLQLTFSITRHQEPLCTQTMLFARQGHLVTIQDDHMLYLKWNTSRHPKLNVNIAIRLLHCVCYHMIPDRTSTEEMLFWLKRQTVVTGKNPTHLSLAFKHHFYFVWTLWSYGFVLSLGGWGEKATNKTQPCLTVFLLSTFVYSNRNETHLQKAINLWLPTAGTPIRKIIFLFSDTKIFLLS